MLQNYTHVLNRSIISETVGTDKESFRDNISNFSFLDKKNM